jgi:hypothetical protein
MQQISDQHHHLSSDKPDLVVFNLFVMSEVMLVLFANSYALGHPAVVIPPSLHLATHASAPQCTNTVRDSCA